jgi:hypothetical protein
MNPRPRTPATGAARHGTRGLQQVAQFVGRIARRPALLQPVENVTPAAARVPG